MSQPLHHTGIACIAQNEDTGHSDFSNVVAMMLMNSHAHTGILQSPTLVQYSQQLRVNTNTFYADLQMPVISCT